MARWMRILRQPACFLAVCRLLRLFQKNYKHTGQAQQDVTATYPSLHEDVVNALDNVPKPAPLFNHDGRKSEIIKSCNTNIMGRFACQNPKCSSPGWGSKKIAIQIRGFRNNTYDAVVFKQRCRTCQYLGTMHIDDNSYIERVAYRLKKWAGVPVETPEYNAVVGKPPHESSLCEGCKAKCCPMLR
ncbi:zinc-binding domain-containing protein [Schizothecium vesticola]|uniref:Zinc-binding domain-containing protein n=1 Tax=Schizothecium vesticola TaxID=314040 RepID=A0AA40F1N7_9PEZI|nr:zinc-binding domain-containing protein [Schizothecium vesticola]